MNFSSLAILAVSFLTTATVTKALIPYLLSRGVVDVTNERSSHEGVVPRGGGIGILSGLAVAAILSPFLGHPFHATSLILCTMAMAALGLLDDVRGGTSVRFRLICQLAIAVAFVSHRGGLDRLPLPAPLDISVGPMGSALAVLWIVGVVNLYNFQDGIDGFAAAHGVIAGASIALLGAETALLPIGLGLAGACCGFLVHNWHPARIFMGDVGSISLGFLLAAIPFQTHGPGRSVLVFVVAICLWFFLTDGTLTIFRRVLRGMNIAKPHRMHLYQRLVTTGLSHDQVVCTIGGAAAMLAGATVVVHRTMRLESQWTVLALALSAFVAYVQWTRRRERQFLTGQRSTKSRFNSQTTMSRPS